MLARGARGTFVPADQPDTPVEVRVAGAPPVANDAVTSKLELSIVGRTGEAVRGGAGWVELAAIERRVLVVPAQAVMESHDGPFVFTVSAEGRSFTRRPVRIGRVEGGWAVVQEGVEAGERLVGMSAFLLEAERRIVSERRRPGELER